MYKTIERISAFFYHERSWQNFFKGKKSGARTTRWIRLHSVEFGCIWLLFACKRLNSDEIGCFYMKSDDFGCFWMLLDALSCFWMLLDEFGCFELLLGKKRANSIFLSAKWEKKEKKSRARTTSWIRLHSVAFCLQTVEFGCHLDAFELQTPSNFENLSWIRLLLPRMQPNSAWCR